MSFFEELERIKAIRDLGDTVEIKTTEDTHLVPKAELKFFIDEEMQTFCFQNHGSNTIWFSTWSQIRDQMEKNNVTLPEKVVPCRTCDGSKCRFWCPRH